MYHTVNLNLQLHNITASRNFVLCLLLNGIRTKMGKKTGSCDPSCNRKQTDQYKHDKSCVTISCSISRLHMTKLNTIPPLNKPYRNHIS